MPLSIIIVGGVAGGMSAATRARRLDENASITVLERGSFVSYANCGVPYALGGVIDSDKNLVLQTEASLEARFNIDIRLLSELVEVDPQTRRVNIHDLESDNFYKMSYDKLILAQGAQSVIPAIPGMGLAPILTLQTIPDLQKIREFISNNSCKRAAIIGGGFIGLEAAENIRKLGLDVSMVESSSHVFPPFDDDLASIIHRELESHQVHLLTNQKVTEILEDRSSVKIQLSGGETLSADVVIVAVGVRARAQIAETAGLRVGRSGVTVNLFMQTSDPDIYAVGDMVEVENRISHQATSLALGGPANRQGRIAADHIFGNPTPYRGNVGTCVCQIFNLTAATTGFSVQRLENLGFRPLWVTVHPPDHASYYPSASPITLRVAFEPGTGRLLGAQAVGEKGVDKRIDVLSIALQANMSIFDLEHVELGYAPPYGSAKDPINMAGFVGSNLLRGLVEIVHPKAASHLTASWQVIDVRSPDEFSRGHIPCARNIPLDQVRQNIQHLRKECPVLVYCWVGYRGYIAYRILRQAGFKVANLDGGFKSIVQGGFADLISPVIPEA
ncbi:Uncharacterized protein PECH_004274 [Penicillium ucsense]|uniref:Rhodanese domain-containing protein n=1 Tax=Penicillium ucsense TaxID=2839758 RepID=A0A8J8WAM3_9EURO|nr:Uncharacterized protein PECM_001162 [Penicillium ucsense]KAF7737159.1 Uncharacterized protein PECH_004274 [Penicillium ucsense]